MNLGDIVLVPDGADIFFAEICSNYYMDSKFDSDQIGYPHQRKVKWLQSVARDELSKSLSSTLKVHRTTADLSKHYDEIAAISHGEDFNSSLALPSIMMPSSFCPIRNSVKIILYRANIFIALRKQYQS